MQKGNQLVGNLRKPRWGFDYAVGTLVTQFASGHGFTTSGAHASSNVNDTTTGLAIFGTQCATVVSDGIGSASAILQKTGLAAIDTTNLCAYLVLKVDDVTKLASLNFSIGVGGFTNEYHVGFANQGCVTSGKWVAVKLCLGDAVSQGSPTRTGITAIRVYHKDDGTGQVTINWGMIAFMPNAAVLPGFPFPKGVASISFDDGPVTQWNAAKPYLDAAGLRASMFVIKDQVGLSNKVTLANLQSMQDQSGWEINGHTLTDANHTSRLTNLTAQQLYQDLTDEKEWLLENNLEGQGHAYPGGVMNAAVVARLRPLYRYARGTQGLTECFPPADPYRIKAFSSISNFSGGTTPASITTAATGKIDLAVTEGAWLNLVFHKVIPQMLSGVMAGNILTLTFASAHTFTNGATIALGNFTTGGFNATNWVIASIPTTSSITINIGSALASPVLNGTEYALTATTECSYYGFTTIVDKLVSSGITVLPMGEVIEAATIPSAYNKTSLDDLRLSGTGLITENMPLTSVSSSTVLVSQSVYYQAVGLRKGQVITGAAFAVAVASASSTSLFVGLYTGAGSRVAVSADQTTTLDGLTGLKTVAFTSTYTVPSDGTYYVAVLSVATTPPTLVRGSTSSTIVVGVGSGVRPCAVQTGQTTLPSAATFSNGNIAAWAGLY